VSGPGGRRAGFTVEAAFPAAPLDPGARLLTGVGALAAVGGAAGLALAEAGPLALAGSPTLVVALLALPLALSPAGYAVGGGDFAVLRRGARPLLFPLAGLAAAAPAAMPPSLRLLGSGGMFGWYGRFRAGEWGAYRAYATDRRRGVLLQWPDGRLFVSPEDPEALCQAVLARRSPARPGPEAPR
jgi:hypothetical protein